MHIFNSYAAYLHLEIILGNTKPKSVKKDGVKKHQKQEQAKKKAIKDRRRVELPDNYKKK
jgi:hypothetical protein